MSDLLQEIEEELKEERVINLWRRYGNAIIGVALTIIFVTIGYSIWNYWQTKVIAQAESNYVSALALIKQGKLKEAQDLLSDVAKGKSGYAGLARLQSAALEVNEGKKQQAYQELAKKEARDPAISGLAKIFEASILLSQNHTQEVDSVVQSLTTPQHPWRGFALELIALAALKNNNNQKAVAQLQAILEDQGISDGNQSRAFLMMTQVAPRIKITPQSTNSPRQKKD